MAATAAPMPASPREAVSSGARNRVYVSPLDTDVVDEEVEVIPRWPFREHAAPEPVKIAVKIGSTAAGARETAAA